MSYTVKNNDLFERLLSFYSEFDLKVKWLDIYLYWSLSYLYFTNDSDIIVWDIDLITDENNFSKIVDLYKNDRGVICEITDHNSVRLFKNWAKLSIHSLQDANNICDLTKNIQQININWVIFKSLSLPDLIKFYKKWNDYDNSKKAWNWEKFYNLLDKSYGLDYTFFMLKPSTLSRKNENWEYIYKDIEKYITKNGFNIDDKKEVILTWDDVEYLYKDEYIKLIDILWEESMKKAIEINKNLYTNKKVIFLLAKWFDAINRWDYIKWNTYWPKKCREDSIRYIFRDKQFDDFDFQTWKIVEVPCDNLVHCPKNFVEFRKVLEKWFL